MIISETYAEFKLPSLTRMVIYSDIKKFHVGYHKGTGLAIRFKDNTKFELGANIYFCNVLPFDAVCKEIEDNFNNYTKKNQQSL